MKIVGKTDIGRVRNTNQDAFKILALGAGAGLALVCDGMGGASGGDRASALAKEVITEVVCARYRDDMGPDAVKIAVREAVMEANRRIYETAQEDPALQGMGTTVVLALLYQNHAYIAHVGDSRLYCFRDGALSQLTRDHSFIQELLDQGKISKDEAKVHPSKNIITRAGGVQWDVELDFHVLELCPGDRLLLCTDGLSNACSDAEIAALLGSRPAEEAAEELIRSANRSGGHDNVTVVIVES